ncbi:hypothetical protein V6N12_069307 [Hibiscus sabdariffa]|uniref:Secreted protein n=1 Tax=Hibiscus sabdariffa TaxID=183260 RepID=A0ABR2FDG2_9ROSI
MTLMALCFYKSVEMLVPVCVYRLRMLYKGTNICPNKGLPSTQPMSIKALWFYKGTKMYVFLCVYRWHKLYKNSEDASTYAITFNIVS